MHGTTLADDKEFISLCSLPAKIANIIRGYPNVANSMQRTLSAAPVAMSPKMLGTFIAPGAQRNA